MGWLNICIKNIKNSIFYAMYLARTLPLTAKLKFFCFILLISFISQIGDFYNLPILLMSPLGFLTSLRILLASFIATLFTISLVRFVNDGNLILSRGFNRPELTKFFLYCLCIYIPSLFILPFFKYLPLSFFLLSLLLLGPLYLIILNILLYSLALYGYDFKSSLNLVISLFKNKISWVLGWTLYIIMLLLTLLCISLFVLLIAFIGMVPLYFLALLILSLGILGLAIIAILAIPLSILLLYLALCLIIFFQVLTYYPHILYFKTLMKKAKLPLHEKIPKGDLRLMIALLISLFLFSLFVALF